MPSAFGWRYVQKFWFSYITLYLKNFFHIVIDPRISFALSAEIAQQSDSGILSRKEGKANDQINWMHCLDHIILDIWSSKKMLGFIGFSCQVIF